MLSASPEHLENAGPAQPQPDSASGVEAGALQNIGAGANYRKNKRPRTGRRRRNRRESFAAGEHQHLMVPGGGSASASHGRGGGGGGRARPPLPASPSRPNSNQTTTMVGQHGICYPLDDSAANRSTTSLESEALLDHRFALFRLLQFPSSPPSFPLWPAPVLFPATRTSACSSIRNSLLDSEGIRRSFARRKNFFFGWE
jgi:hypothetical protein